MGKRERRRYIAFDLLSEGEITKNMLIRTIANEIMRVYGEYGASKAQFWLSYYEEKSKRGIIQCSHKTVDLIRVPLATITNIEKTPVLIHVLGISGTIKTAKDKYFGEAKPVSESSLPDDGPK
ncbi:MAG: Rpp14/Pop5 family protein [Candidatus Hodarchaeota archaeon]